MRQEVVLSCQVTNESGPIVRRPDLHRSIKGWQDNERKYLLLGRRCVRRVQSSESEFADSRLKRTRRVISPRWKVRMWNDGERTCRAPPGRELIFLCNRALTHVRSCSFLLSARVLMNYHMRGGGTRAVGAAKWRMVNVKCWVFFFFLCCVTILTWKSTSFFWAELIIFTILSSQYHTVTGL